MTPIPDTLWTYRARLDKVVDGDTLDLYLDAGFRNYRTERLRLLLVDTPEIRGASRPAGLAATAFVTEWLQHGRALDEWHLVVRTHKADAFGRYLGMVWRVVDGACLQDALLAANHAVPYEE